MKFEEALHNLLMVIEQEYGISGGVTKIGLSYKAMEAFQRDIASSDPYRYRPSRFGEIKFFGVEIVARERDKF